jgi:hypothetical protein
MAWLEGQHESVGENDIQRQLLKEKKIKFTEEREREGGCTHHVRWSGCYL